jgi:hypothetical protein
MDLCRLLPRADFALATAWLATQWLLRESGVWRDRNTAEVREAQRHADYAYRLAVEPPAAKELRLFGLADWIVERFRSRRYRLFELQWQATRRRERQVIWSLLLVVAANIVIFRAMADAAADGRLVAGLDTQLGSTWPDGVDISFGQWQKLALARGFMREHPLLLVLDEPTAWLDAETEHALFQRYAAAARTGGSGRATDDGRITLLVSHRFSTVRMADFIVVIDGSLVAEAGSHEELMAKGGQYAELHGIQAAAYR